MNQIHIDILRENINILNLSADWVRHSYEQTNTIELKTEYATDEFDKLENLTSRYARTTDMLINKVYEALILLNQRIIDMNNPA